MLLTVVYAVWLPGNATYEWAGPANDVVGGVVAPAAIIPVVLAMRELSGDGVVMRLMTAATATAMVTFIGLSAVIVVGTVPLAVQFAVGGVAFVVLFAWVGVAATAACDRGLLPRRIALWGRAIGLAAPTLVVLGSVGALLPWGSIPQFVVGGVVVAVVAGAHLSLPVWLIALSNVMDRHTAAWGELSLQAGLTEGRPRQTGALSR